MNSAAGPVIKFTRVTQTPFPQEGLPVYESETVAQLAVTMQPLGAKATSTQLLPASDGGKQVGLEIRGNSWILCSALLVADRINEPSVTVLCIDDVRAAQCESYSQVRAKQTVQTWGTEWILPNQQKADSLAS